MVGDCRRFFGDSRIGAGWCCIVTGVSWEGFGTTYPFRCLGCALDVEPDVKKMIHLAPMNERALLVDSSKWRSFS